jgi:lipid-A-disaccharide synthase
MVVKEQSHTCMKAARAGLIKSGTSTLEAALLQLPMVLAYHSSRSAEWVYRHIVRYRGFVGLVNLFLEPNPKAALGLEGNPIPVVPEMILDCCQPDLIADALMGIYQEGLAREKMLQALARIQPALRPPPELERSPIQAAASAVSGVLGQ